MCLGKPAGALSIVPEDAGSEVPTHRPTACGAEPYPALTALGVVEVLEPLGSVASTSSPPATAR